MEFDLNKSKDLSKFSKKIKYNKNCINCIENKKWNCHINPSNLFLSKKYSLSLVYHYLKNINPIIDDSNKKSNLMYKEVILMNDEEEYQKRFYHLAEFNVKMNLINEYYKFHEPKPVFFMKNYIEIMDYYNTKKMRINYKKIAKENNFESSIENSQISSFKSDEKTNSIGFKNLNSLKNILNNSIIYNPLLEFKKKHKSGLLIKGISEIIQKNIKNKNELTVRNIFKNLDKVLKIKKKSIHKKSNSKNNFLKKKNWDKNKIVPENLKNLIIKNNKIKKNKIKNKLSNNFNNININILIDQKKKNSCNISYNKKIKKNTSGNLFSSQFKNSINFKKKEIKNSSKKRKIQSMDNNIVLRNNKSLKKIKKNNNLDIKKIKTTTKLDNKIDFFTIKKNSNKIISYKSNRKNSKNKTFFDFFGQKYSYGSNNFNFIKKTKISENKNNFLKKKKQSILDFNLNNKKLFDKNKFKKKFKSKVN